jgi:CheY-like chemotaxis protein
MEILIVEDDENKRTQTSGFISNLVPGVRIVTANALQSGLRKIISGHFDLIILDMSMPTFDIDLHEDGGRMQAYAGREILWQMERREIEVPVLVLTQFDVFGKGDDALTLRELDETLRTTHPNTYKGLVYYDVAMGTWKEKLRNAIRELVK